jgi:hypothetical protein
VKIIKNNLSQNRALYLISLSLFLIQFFANLLMVICANSQGTLTGEETSITFRDVFLLPYRIQHNSFASNIGSQFIYWVASHSFPNLSLFYGRFTKAFLTAFSSPLIYLIQIKKIQIRPKTAYLTSILFIFLPAVLNFNWIATEPGLDGVFGLVALLFATSNSFYYNLLAVTFAGISALNYSTGIIYIAPIFIIIFLNIKENKKWTYILVFYLLVFSMTLLTPYLWWKGLPTPFVGGGTLSSFSEAKNNFIQLFIESGLHGGSYYYFSEYPGFSSFILMIFAFLGYLIAHKSRRNSWIILGFGFSVLVYLASGRAIGIRRGLPALIFSIFFVGLALDWISEKKIFKRRKILFWFPLFLIFFIELSQYQNTLDRLANKTTLLPIDFRFYIPDLPAGQTMESTYMSLFNSPHICEMPSLYEPDRTVSVLYLLSKRNHLATQPSLSEEYVMRCMKKDP